MAFPTGSLRSRGFRCGLRAAAFADCWPVIPRVTPGSAPGKLAAMQCGLINGLRAFLTAGACALALAADAPVNTNPPTPAATNEVAILKTSAGEMVLEFWPDVAPKTVENFKKLAREGFYDGTCFHRIIKGFMIQGGDPKTKDPSKEAEWGTGDPGYKIKAEFNDRKHVRGVISMARAAHPDSAGCQFFICLEAAPFLDGKYTAFGKLIKGEDVLLKLGDTPVGPSPSGERSKPLQRVALESVKIVPASAVK
jgi:peptidyl-prolyl cis-trans isomerase B (cyclophilin B)